jgi:dTDP-glucose 4,6-dehydratase
METTDNRVQTTDHGSQTESGLCSIVSYLLSVISFRYNRDDMKTVLITGGAGFIGSNFVRYALQHHDDWRVVVFDKLTYAGNLDNLKDIAEGFRGRYAFVHGDIADREVVFSAVQEHDVNIVVNFAADTHVDRSLMEPGTFIMTDVYGTYVLLEAAREFKVERYHQIGTDEVYGDIPEGQRSTELDPLRPSSPYSASKTGGDVMCLAYHRSFGVPVTLTRASNNIGPYQYPEKAVPLFITNAIDDIPLPLYGDGMQQRDYQYVLDHCEGIDLVIEKGQLGEVYNIGSGVETHNIDMVHAILDLLGKPYSLIQPVKDRPGHDRRYALDTAKIRALGWRSGHTFAQAIEATVRWYVDNESWWRKLKSGEYLEYYKQQYANRHV